MATVKEADEEPPTTTTEDGTIAFELLDAKLTTKPLLGAKPLRVTVPFDVEPPVTVEGDSEILTRVAGVIVNGAVRLTPVSEAVMVAAVIAETPDVGIVNVAVVVPEATVTDVGGVALRLLELRPTTIPPDCAMPFRVTVPVAELPPTTDVGTTARPIRDGGLTVKVVVSETEEWVAVIVTVT